MKHKCGICQRLQSDCVVLTLTREEKAVLEKGMSQVPSTLAYCQPCWKIMGDRERGAQLMKGIWESNLRRVGVPRAENKAQQFYDKLLAKTPAKGKS